MALDTHSRNGLEDDVLQRDEMERDRWVSWIEMQLLAGWAMQGAQKLEVTLAGRKVISRRRGVERHWISLVREKFHQVAAALLWLRGSTGVSVAICPREPPPPSLTEI